MKMMGLARNLFVVVVLVGAVLWSFLIVPVEPEHTFDHGPGCVGHSPDVLYGPGRGPGPLSASREFGAELIVNGPTDSM